MSGDRLFYTEENKVLISICARKLISKIGIGGIIWGAICIAVGIDSLPLSILNIGLVILGLIMLGTGIIAIKSPSLGVLLTEAIVAILIFLWNLGVSTLNYRASGVFEIQYLIMPLIFASIFIIYYVRLGHLRKQIASIDPAKIRQTRKICKALLKKKIKKEPSIIETKDRRCRAQLMEEKAFFIQRKMTRAFVGSKKEIRNAIVKSDAKSLKLLFRHPLGKLRYRFDRKNSEKLKNWLAMRAGPKTE